MAIVSLAKSETLQNFPEEVNKLLNNLNDFKEEFDKQKIQQNRDNTKFLSDLAVTVGRTYVSIIEETLKNNDVEKAKSTYIAFKKDFSELNLKAIVVEENKQCIFKNLRAISRAFFSAKVEMPG